MDNWLQLLKNALSLDIPDDHISHDKKYGSIPDNLKHIYPSVFKYWKIGAFAYSLLLITSLLTFPMPMITRFLIDDVIGNKRLSLLLPVLLIIVSISVFNMVAGKLQGFYNTRFDQKVMLHLQERLLSRVFALPKTFFDKIHRGYLMSRLTSDIGGVKWFFSSTIVQIITQFIRFVGGVIFLFYLEWRIAIPIILFLPVPLIAAKYFARKSYIMSHQGSERGARYASVFQEVLSSIPLIKSFSTEKRAINNITDEIKRNNQLANERYMLSSLNGIVQNIIPQLAGLFVLGFGTYWVIIDYWSLGSLLAFRSYLSYVYGPVGFLSSSASQLQSSRAALQRTAALFETIPEANTDDGNKIEKISGQVEFKNVSFSYDPEKPVLENISLKTKPGEQWAVIGESGIGKTTLISLLMRFYIPKEGELYFDNIPVSDLNVRSLRSRIGYVAQSTMLISGKIIDNLKYGNPEASHEDAVNAAKTADIHDFIEQLPNKYDSILEEGGLNMSEGQKQRLSIARALVKNPDILIFDEPTAALDNVTEHSIYRQLPEVVKGKTTFTIAHRLNTIKDADKILMLRGNKPSLIGTHEELFAKETDYQKFFDDL
jgi:ABC-type bacteriocin/lantibiotic exporter with double-glycine peptidase domain